MPCEDEEARAKGRREDAGRLESTSQGTPVVARKPPEAGAEAQGHSLYSPRKEPALPTP